MSIICFFLLKNVFKKNASFLWRNEDCRFKIVRTLIEVDIIGSAYKCYHSLVSKDISVNFTSIRTFLSIILEQMQRYMHFMLNNIVKNMKLLKIEKNISLLKGT